MPNFLTRLFRGDSAPAPVLRRRDTGTSADFLPNGVEGGWANPYTGLGVAGLDMTAQLQYQSGRIPTAQLVDQLYTYDWLADRVIEKMPSIAMVRGFDIEGESDSTSELERDFRTLNVTERFPRGAFQRAIYDGRAYGSSVLLLGYRLGNPTSELTPEQAKGGIAFFDVFGQHELQVLTRYEDPNDPRFGMPELYRVIQAGNGLPHPRRGQIFHASRSIRFAGRPLRVNTSACIDLSDSSGAGHWPEIGVSVLTPILTTIGQYGLAWSAVSNMLQDASIGWMKISGLVEALASEDKAIIEDRLRVLQQTKGTHRMWWLDADAGEEAGRTEVKLTDVPAVLQQIIVNVSGAADIPAQIFFSSSPQGLNANSAGDANFKQLYNTCVNYQDQYLGPKLETILTAVNGGREVHVEWPSLWESSDNEIAQTRLAHANATKVMWDMGAVEATDVVQAAKTGVYPETLGTPTDDRAALNPKGEGEEPSTGATGAAPDKAGASKIATKQRAEQSKK